VDDLDARRRGADQVREVEGRGGRRLLVEGALGGARQGQDLGRAGVGASASRWRAIVATSAAGSAISEAMVTARCYRSRRRRAPAWARSATSTAPGAVPSPMVQRAIALVVLAACGGSSPAIVDAAIADAATGDGASGGDAAELDSAEPDAAVVDAAAIDAAAVDAAAVDAAATDVAAIDASVPDASASDASAPDAAAIDAAAPDAAEADASPPDAAEADAPPPVAPLAAHRRPDEVALEVGQLARAQGPGLGELSAAPGRLTRLAEASPLERGRRQALAARAVLGVELEPLAQGRPAGDQDLVGQLVERRAVIVVDHQQAGRAPGPRAPPDLRPR
jgi:hypothetical protein